jgi:ParB-like chromosome segregation protein Spo0J
MEFHEYANLFPMMPKSEVERLAGDIKEKGLQDDIITFDGKILDGRNRHAACKIAGVVPRFTEYKGTDPLGFVVSHNLHRRHLNESQRGQVAAKMAKLPRGANQHRPIELPSQKEAADMLNVSTNTVKRSKVVLEHGITELADMQQSGEISASAAEAVARLPKDEQRKAVAGGISGVKEAAKKLVSGTRQSEPQSSDQASQSKRQPPLKIAHAMGIFAVARNHMDKIAKNDKERIQALNSMIEYCQSRISNNQ